MSEANVEVVRRLFPAPIDYVTAFVSEEGAEATRTAMEPLVEPDFETVTVPGQVPLEGIAAPDPGRPAVYGLDGLFAGLRGWLSAWEAWEVTVTDVIDVDSERVLVLVDVRARSKRHGVDIPITGANLLTLRNGKISRMELFFDRGQAYEAAGL